MTSSDAPSPSDAAFDAPFDEGAIRIARLFPTPLASIVHPDAARLNPALRDAILARERRDAGVSHSNAGGWQSGDDFADWSGPAGAALCGFATAFARSLSAVAHPTGGLLEATIDWTFNAWANINRDGHGNDLHGHPGAYWSGVYWVDDGGAGDADATGGALQFHDPRGILPTMLSPYLRMKIEGCLSAGLVHSVRPESGTFVMFPSWLLHAVTPHRGTRPRLSIAFNFAPPMG